MTPFSFNGSNLTGKPSVLVKILSLSGTKVLYDGKTVLDFNLTIEDSR